MCEKMYQTAKLKNADIVVCDKNIIQDEKIINIKGNKRNMDIEISSVGDFIKNIIIQENTKIMYGTKCLDYL